MLDVLLELRSVSKAFQGVRALRSVSFDLRAGEVHALVGENGAGKSTLIRIVTGAHSLDEGELWLGGEKVGDYNPRIAHARGVAAIYQQPALFPDLTVAENLGIALEPGTGFRWIRWGARRERAQGLLRRVGARIDPDRLVSELSMPEQQLVEIAKALGAGARVLIMDEPTASLTPEDVGRLSGLVRALRSEGVGVLYISHRLEEIFDLADRVTILRDGEVVGTHEIGSVDRGKMIRMMVGRDVTAEYPVAVEGRGGIRLEVKDLRCREAGIEGVTLHARAGEVVSVAGLVGAGRTELARVLFGITPKDGGEILIDGVSVAVGSPRDAISAGLCYLPEDRRRHGVVGEMSVVENMGLAVLSRMFPWGWIRGETELELATRYVKDLGVKPASAYAPAGSLSGGNQQKVALARWLAAGPRVLILDEPTQGVDVGAKSEIHRIVRGLADSGMAVIVISSDLTEVLGMGDRVLVMARGRIVKEYTRAEATAEGVMRSALVESGDEVCERGGGR